MYRNDVCLESIRRLRRLLNKVVGKADHVDIHKLMYAELPRLSGEWLVEYQFRFLGLDQDDPDHRNYERWVFSLHWQDIDPLGTAWAYRIMYLLSEFPLPCWPIDRPVDWRLVNRLYPYSDLATSGESFLNVTKFLYKLPDAETEATETEATETEATGPWANCRLKGNQIHA